jgi:hypothetical protein
MDQIDFQLLDKCVVRSVDLLHRTFHSSSSGGGGWYHSLEVGQPGPSATAAGIASFLMFDESNENLAAALSFLRARQISSSEKKLDGGWAVNTSFGLPLTEATALIARILARNRLTFMPGAPNIGRAHSWLVHNQNTDGGWGSFFGHSSRVWLTAMAVRAMAELDSYGSALRRGVQWLVDHRDPTTLSWGEVPGGPPTVTHTAFVLTALVDGGAFRVDRAVAEVVVRGYDWLQSHLDTSVVHDDAARVESYNLACKLASGAPVTFHSTVWHPSLPYSISALMRHPIGAEPSLLAGAIRTLIAKQLPDGRWPNPDSAASVSIWSVWPFLESIKDVTQYGLSRAGDQVTWYGADTVVVQRAHARGTSVLRLEWRAKLLRMRALITRHWASAILMLAITLGGSSALLGKIGWQELSFGVGVPVFLLFVQESIHRTTSRDRGVG